MRAPKHTPGPWFCEYGTDGYYGLYHNGDEPLDQNVPANEILIAAAPDLLAVLISTRDSLQAMADEGIVAQGSWPTVNAAIAKATGEPS